MAGAEVYRFAVKAMGDACCRVLELAQISPNQIDVSKMSPDKTGRSPLIERKRKDAAEETPRPEPVEGRS